jgi:CRP-like cAMP-binding protein/Ca2+/Na+ antiporter
MAPDDRPASRRVSRRTARALLRRLGQIGVLRALPPEEVQALVPLVDEVRFPAGAVLMREGDPGDALYLIEDGRASVTRTVNGQRWQVDSGSVVGEAALLTGERRSATVTAESPLTVLRIAKDAFDGVVARSPNLRLALEQVVENRRRGVPEALPSSAAWASTAMRALEARSRGVEPWLLIMLLGMLGWLGLTLRDTLGWNAAAMQDGWTALAQLVVGLLIIQGACEAFIHGVERLGARLRWDGFISGTIGSALSTLPEFVVIAFLVLVEPLVAFVTTIVTIFNNALAFSIYSFFLPKDRRGAFDMPHSLTAAGGEILIAGGAITLIVGIVMLIVRVAGDSQALAGGDLVSIGAVLMVIYGYYLMTLIKYYGEGGDDPESMPPDPGRLGHDTRWPAIVSMLGLGLAGAYCGGESIGRFADIAITELGLPMIPTAAALAFFAGISEYIIVYKSHRRGELGIALSNVFGGLTQVMFLLLPFALLVIGVAGLVTGNPLYSVPVNAVTILLTLLLFPLFYALHQCMEQDKSLSNLDAAAMTGIYALLLYFLFTIRA